MYSDFKSCSMRSLQLLVLSLCKQQITGRSIYACRLFQVRQLKNTFHQHLPFLSMHCRNPEIVNIPRHLIHFIYKLVLASKIWVLVQCGTSIYPKGPKRTQKEQKDPKGTPKTQKDFIKHVELKMDAIIISIKVFYISLVFNRNKNKCNYYLNIIIIYMYHLFVGKRTHKDFIKHVQRKLF